MLLQVSEARLSNLMQEQRALSGMVDDLARRRADADRALQEQRSKVSRAERTAERTGATQPPVVLAEAELAEMRDMARAMLSELKALAAMHPGAGIVDAVEMAGLRLPTGGPGSSAPSASGSRPGSMGSERSAGSMASARSGSGSVRGSPRTGGGAGGVAPRPGSGLRPRAIQLGVM